MNLRSLPEITRAFGLDEPPREWLRAHRELRVRDAQTASFADEHGPARPSDFDAAPASGGPAGAAGSTACDGLVQSHGDADGVEVDGVDLDVVARSAAWIGIPEWLRTRILTAARALNASTALRSAAAILRYLLFCAPDRARVPASAFPLPRIPLFYVPLFLEEVPALRRMHARRGIPAERTRELLGDIELWIHEHQSRNGDWDLSEMKWLRRHLWGEIYSLGRLQFQLSEFSWPFRVYRGLGRYCAPIVLVEGVREYRIDGQFADADRGSLYPPHAPDRMPPRQTEYAECTAGVRGNVVADSGRITGRVATVGSRDAMPVLSRGDPVLAVHIPSGSPLAPDAVRSSLSDAREFFRRYFPEQRFHAFTCNTWLLDPTLSLYLPDGSNIVRFRKRFRLHPLPGANDNQHFERVFCVSINDVEAMTPKTSLQGALMAHVRSGGAWRSGGGFIVL